MSFTLLSAVLWVGEIYREKVLKIQFMSDFFYSAKSRFEERVRCVHLLPESEPDGKRAQQHKKWSYPRGSYAKSDGSTRTLTVQ